MRFTIATYNVHDCVGTDGRRDPERLARVIAETGADVLALQEVSGPGEDGRPDPRPDDFRLLAQAFGGYAVEGPAVIDGARRYGNMLLSRWPVSKWAVADLAQSEREPRNAIDAILETPAGPMQVIASHFGLRHRERRRQALMIGDMAQQTDTRPTLVMGDFNDWFPLSPIVRQLGAAIGRSLWQVPRRPTFPAGFPVLALDRILVSRHGRILRTRVPGDAVVRLASDHRPLVAEIEFDPAFS